MSILANNDNSRNNLRFDFNVLYAGGDPRLFPTSIKRPYARREFHPQGILHLSKDELIFRPTDPKTPKLTWPDVSIRTVAYKRTFLCYGGYVTASKDIILDSQLRNLVDLRKITEGKRPRPALCIEVDDPARVFPFLSIYFCFETKYDALVAAKRMLSIYALITDGVKNKENMIDEDTDDDPVDGQEDEDDELE